MTSYDTIMHSYRRPITVRPWLKISERIEYIYKPTSLTYKPLVCMIR